MRFSLIVATIGRTTELQRLCQSLSAQTFHDFELIVVDQNSDERLAEIIGQYRESCTIMHLRSAPGISRARNTGLSNITGDIIAFPDDDCWYPPRLLQNIATLLERHPEWDGIAGKCIDESGTPTVNHIDTNAGRVTRLNALRRGSSATIFLRRRVVERIGGFDESMGLGAPTPWHSAEDVDLIVRAVQAGFTLQLQPQIWLWHRQLIPGYDSDAVAKRRAYSMGVGRLLRKHSYPLVFIVLLLAADSKNMARAVLTGKLRQTPFHLAALCGLVRGWLSR